MEMTDFRKIYLFIRRLKGWSDVYYDKSNTLDEFLRYLLHMLFYEGTTDLASWAEFVESKAYDYSGQLKNDLDVRELASDIRSLNLREQRIAHRAMAILDRNGYSLPPSDWISHLNDLTDDLFQNSSNKVLLFKGMLKNYMAVGRSADLINKKLGWQTATVEFQGGSCCFMVLCDYSLEVIGKVLDYEVHDTMCNFHGLDLMGDDSVNFSLQQQMIDYFMVMVGEIENLSTKGLSYRKVDEKGNICETSYPYMMVSSEWLHLFSSQAETLEIVSNHQWKISLDELDLLCLLADFASEKLKIKGGPQMIGMDEMFNSMNCIDQYVFIKTIMEDHHDKVLIMDYGGTYESYGDDAIFLADKYKVTLWSRSSMGDLVLPAVVIADDLIARIRTEVPNVVVWKEKFSDPSDVMSMFPNPMDLGLKDKNKYDNVKLSKRKDGKYVIRAFLGNSRLPVRQVPEDLAQHFQSLPDGVVRETVLKTILYSVYSQTNSEQK